MNSIQLTIQANEEQQEILISQLDELHANGFEQTNDSLIAYFAENNFDSYEIYQLLQDYTFTIATIEEQNWNQVWESNFTPVFVDDFCAIRANFHEPVRNVEHEIIITPKMSFGTGHHATTYMMVQQMREISFSNKTVFDFGTGTGILAILAEKLGASSVSAIDVDDWSIENASENLVENGCTKITLELSSTIPARPFDIILANINRNVILSNLPQLKKALPAGGVLLLSGLLTTDQTDVVTAGSQIKLDLVKQTQKDNWISLLFINRI
ncbi:MAG TPA: 50S ribosomal protein L11 methyltransferase [Flavisolibacter sp.]|nr:50S ribosomal protein L11 methyltransferase [Flavisolibacter sp.]